MEEITITQQELVDAMINWEEDYANNPESFENVSKLEPRERAIKRGNFLWGLLTGEFE